MNRATDLPQRPPWTVAQRVMATGVVVGVLVVIGILLGSLLSVRSLELELRQRSDASEQFIAVMREAGRLELELVRSGDPTSPEVLERHDILHRHVDVLRSETAELAPGSPRGVRLHSIIDGYAAVDELLHSTPPPDAAEVATVLSGMEQAAKAAADIAETTRRATTLQQVTSARQVASATLVAITVVIVVIGLLLLSLRRRSLRALEDAYALAVTRAEALEDANRLLQEANATKQRFLSMVSHELRTPLTVIRGFAETLAERSGLLDTEQRATLSGAIVRHAVRQQRMVDDLLVLARHTDHAPDPRPASIDVGMFLRRIVDELTDPTTTVEVLPGPSCVAWADPHHVEQVLENLVTNAQKYGGERIEMSWAATDHRVAVVVEDDGDGVPDEFVPALFAPFAQADDGDTRVSRGVGLGLSIARLLVEGNGGTIRYRHRAGGGARFEVTLPRANADDVARPGFVDRRGADRGLAARGSDTAVADDGAAGDAPADAPQERTDSGQPSASA